MLKRVSTRNLLIFSALLAGLSIISLLLLLYKWEQNQFALKIQTQGELNFKAFQIALDSEFQKNQTRAQLLGEEPAIGAELVQIFNSRLDGKQPSVENLRKQ
ncbi:MAG: hypothetical protein KJT03_17700, partial [Verrucomicrobiae bacterium]|nr:hypothetical protein [Verrucomicrobiae bacterium]